MMNATLRLGSLFRGATKMSVLLAGVTLALSLKATNWAEISLDWKFDGCVARPAAETESAMLLLGSSALRDLIQSAWAECSFVSAIPPGLLLIVK